MERKTPYQMLLEEFREYAGKVESPRKRLMWRYTPENIRECNGFLSQLKERVIAAKQLGYDVVFESDGEGGLQVYYVQKRPDYPTWTLRQR